MESCIFLRDAVQANFYTGQLVWLPVQMALGSTKKYVLLAMNCALFAPQPRRLVKHVRLAGSFNLFSFP